MRKGRAVTVFTEELTRTRLIGNTLDAIIGRLSYDEAFAQALAQDPSETLDAAGFHLDKEAIEKFIKNDSLRFDQICDRLAELIGPDTLAKVVEPTCA